MTVGRRELMAKARAVTTSISKMGKDEKGMAPSGAFGEDYNRLRAAAAELYPALKALLPPEVEVERGEAYGRPFTRERYAEIDTFCEQIYQLLNEQRDE